jgi:hypothetical protein
MWHLLIGIALAASPAEFDLQTIDGQQAHGRLVQLGPQDVVLAGDAGESRYPIASVATLGRTGPAPAKESKASVAVELIDQSVLLGVEYTVDGNQAELQLEGDRSLKIPTRSIRSVRFGPVAARDAKLTKQWSEIVESKAAGDLLVVRKSGALDYLEGVLGTIDADVCQFELDKEPIPVKRAKVEGVVYYHANPPELPEAVGRLISADGTTLALRTIELTEAGLKATTPAGTELELPMEGVARFDFSSGKIAYLSDLEPESVSFTPYIALTDEQSSLNDFFQYRRDVGFEQNPLRLHGKTYRKGLSLQSRTQLVYKLPGKFRVLKTVVGIDDAVRETGDVHLEIRGDGKILWEGEVRGSDPARELELQLDTVKRLEILADYGGGLDIGDRLNLADARVTK